MTMPIPDGTSLLLDVCRDNGAEPVWKKLVSGELPCSHVHLDTGEFRAIESQQWNKNVSIVEPSGKVVKKHAFELLVAGDLTWLVSDGSFGRRVGDDPVIVPSMDALTAAASPPRPRVPAIEKKATGRTTKHDWEGAVTELAAMVYRGDIDHQTPQAKVVELLAGWFIGQGLEPPSDSDLKIRAKRVLDGLKAD